MVIARFRIVILVEIRGELGEWKEKEKNYYIRRVDLVVVMMI